MLVKFTKIKAWWIRPIHFTRFNRRFRTIKETFLKWISVLVRFTDAFMYIPVILTTVDEVLTFLLATQSIGDPQVIQFELADKCMTTLFICFSIDILNTNEPERTDEICYQEHDDNQSSNSERKHYQLLSLGSICSLRIFIVVLH